MKYTPIEINKRTRTIKGKKYVYYEARCTVQLAKESYRENGSGKTRQAAKDALLKKLDAEEKKAEEKTAEEAVIRMVKAGRMSVEEIKEFFPKLSAEQIKQIGKRLSNFLGIR